MTVLLGVTVPFRTDFPLVDLGMTVLLWLAEVPGEVLGRCFPAFARA